MIRASRNWLVPVLGGGLVGFAAAHGNVYGLPPRFYPPKVGTAIRGKDLGQKLFDWINFPPPFTWIILFARQD